MSPSREAPPNGSGPLNGIRVIDLSSALMGPYATQILADYGADVIKVEPPAGDVLRQAGPMRHRDMGPLHLQVNRNKRSIVLDVKQEGGRQALLRLCETADVFLHNIRVAVMDRLRLGAGEVQAVNPRLVYISLIGYGENGPYAGKPAYDDLIQGRVAIPSLFAAAGAAEPRYAPTNIADRTVGIYGVTAVLAALIHRDRTGEGQSIELPMFETMAQFVLGDHMAGRTYQPPLGEAGYSRLMTANRRPYRTADGHVCALLYTDKHWEAFFQAIGRGDEFARDPRLGSQAARARHYDAIYGLLADILRTRPTREWIALLERCDIPCAPLNGLDDLIDDPHLAAVGFFQAIEHPSEGPIRVVGIPSRWSRTQPEITRPAPRLGEHGVEILREVGFDDAAIERLVAEGATVDPAAPVEAVED